MIIIDAFGLATSPKKRTSKVWSIIAEEIQNNGHFRDFFVDNFHHLLKNRTVSQVRPTTAPFYRKHAAISA